jgi:hypothetical protein
MKIQKVVKKLKKLNINDLEIRDNTIYATIPDALETPYLRRIWNAFSTYYTCEIILGKGCLLLTLKPF